MMSVVKVRVVGASNSKCSACGCDCQYSIMHNLGSQKDYEALDIPATWRVLLLIVYASHCQNFECNCSWILISPSFLSCRKGISGSALPYRRSVPTVSAVQLSLLFTTCLCEPYPLEIVSFTLPKWFESPKSIISFFRGWPSLGVHH